MQRVVVERSFDEPANYEQLEAREKAAAWCGTTRRVRFLRSYFSSDKRHMVCLYEAPDAEAVRTFQHAAEMPVTHVYSVHNVVDALPERPRGYSMVVAQRDLTAMPDLTLEMVQHQATDPLGCSRRLRLEHFGAYLSRDLKRMVCTYYTPDLESVRQANRESGTPWEHLWAGEIIAAAE